jgi:hypothetical protein
MRQITDYYFFDIETDDDYSTIMKDECRIEKLLKIINKDIYIDSFIRRDIKESLDGIIFILSTNSINYSHDIKEMVQNELGTQKYSFSLSIENIKIQKGSKTTIGDYETIIIKRKTFKNLPKDFYLRIFIKILLFLIFLYLLILYTRII